MDFLTNLSEGWQFGIQLLVVLICLFYGARKGGIALGLLGGIGILMLVFFTCPVPHKMVRKQVTKGARIVKSFL